MVRFREQVKVVNLFFAVERASHIPFNAFVDDSVAYTHAIKYFERAFGIAKPARTH